MKDIQRVYIINVIFTILLLVFFDSWYVAALLVLQILLPIVIRLLLSIDANNLKVNIEYEEACRIGTSAPFRLLFTSKRYPFVSSLLEVKIEWENRMLGETRVEKIQYVLKGRSDDVPINLGFSCCGEIMIKYITIYCYDVFGLRRKKICSFKNKRIHVYPTDLQIRVQYEKENGGNIEDDWEALPQKGNDNSEVYDLREYQPGDAMRSIHWKLSGKMGKYIIKEAGDTLRTDALVLLDLGRKSDLGENFSKEMLSSVVSLGQICGQNLVENGIHFMMAYATQNQLHRKAVFTQNDLLEEISVWMGVKMPDQIGMAMKYWKRDMQELQFSHIIYVVPHKFPEELLNLHPEMKMTAVCISEEGDKIQISEQGKLRMIDLPYDSLQEKENLILI